MRAQGVVSDGAGGYGVEELEVARPEPGEVLVELKASGICHTDHDLLGVPVPLVLGHEGAGIVAAIGAGVTRVEPGERVVLNWSIPCGDCFQCRLGNEHLCEQGSPLTGGLGGHAHLGSTTRAGQPVIRAFNLGTLSSATVVKEAAVVPLRTDVGWSAAAIAGCGVMTGLGSVLNASPLGEGGSAVVIGCGGVGLNVVQGCRIRGAAMIVAVDPIASRLDRARTFGATHTIRPDPDDRDLSAAVKEVFALTGGRGADVAFEATAVPALAAAPLAMVRHGGTAIQVSGVEQRIEIDMRLFEWDKIYLNPLYGQCAPDTDFPRLFDLHDRGELLLDEQVTETFTLDRIDEGFAALLSGSGAKGVVVM